MRIDGAGAPPPIVPGSLGPAAAPAGAPGSAQQITSLVNQALIQEEQKGGGGGHGGGHRGAKNVALEAIDDIASRASLNIRHNEKSTLARMREIEKMQAELAAKNETIGEKESGEREQADDETPGDEADPEQRA